MDVVRLGKYTTAVAVCCNIMPDASLQPDLGQKHLLTYQMYPLLDKMPQPNQTVSCSLLLVILANTTLLMQVVVAKATRRRQLLRKDFGMQPLKLIHAPPTPIQPAFAVKQPAFNVRHQRGRGTMPVSAVHKQQDRRQLAVTACDEATSDATFGDINFDCQFTFVQV